jgi:hypothetical protein
VVICDFDIISISLPPSETDPPLVIDADTALSGPISFQWLQTVAGNCRKIAEFSRGVQARQSPPRGFLNRSEPPATEAKMQTFGLPAPE